MKIGKFWYYYKVMGMAHDFSISDQDSLGLIDSPYTHVEYWEQLKLSNLNLVELEYKEIPRGRLIYNVNMQKYFVYMGTKLLKRTIANQIAEFFELDFDVVISKKDPHYKT